MSITKITLPQLAKVVGALSVLIGAVYAIDQHYVSAGEFKKEMSAVKGTITDLHMARLEDEIFKLELIPVNRRSDADKALLDRYKRQRRELEFRRQQDMNREGR